jgi:hypothetical protein
MTPEFVFLMNVVLLSRLVYIFRDDRLHAGGLFMLLTVQVIGLLAFQPGVAWGVLLVLFVVVALYFHVRERRSTETEGVRLLALGLQMIVLSVFCSPSIGLTFNSTVLSWLTSLDRFTTLAPVVRGFGGHDNSLVLLGALLVLNEANLLLRIQLASLRMGPGSVAGGASAASAADRQEYNTGRIIGILERVLIYVAALSDQVAAIGLVLAAKGFVRFKELEDRRFAEYVLVGTLLSFSEAVIVALLVKSFL